MFFVHMKMNKVPRKVWKKEVILSWKSLVNHSQNSVRTLLLALLQVALSLVVYMLLLLQLRWVCEYFEEF